MTYNRVCVILSATLITGHSLGGHGGRLGTRLSSTSIFTLSPLPSATALGVLYHLPAQGKGLGTPSAIGLTLAAHAC